ncbi:c-type cytochrome [Lentisphaera profundi]|uniref:C-type cytochrome n=1 Tax=Lentisphaera profundi TaxID=1658616 RepID=A0ABY7W2Z5_9BACT|nr:c-type cytochrome [Lentisphaera profundi]WDE99371.1 c-type cytochrome [Lentisphaera profundi]
MNRKFIAGLGLFSLLSTPLAADSVQEGEKIYNQICHTCHAPDMKGGIGPSLIDDFWKHGDSPEAIFNTIKEGIPNSEMVPYKHLFKDDQISAVRDYIMSKQVGMRSLVLSTYPRNHFKDKDLSLEALKTVESIEQKNVKENLIFFKNNYNGTSHLETNLHVPEDGEYQIKINNIGRTVAYLNGEKIFAQDDKKKPSQSLNKSTHLKKGVHKLDIIHDERPQHALRFHAVLLIKGKSHVGLMGKSLEGSEPKVVRASGEAKVLRKYIHGISPRTLLCLLPNKVMVAYNPYQGKVEAVWKNALLDQTPSLNSRSANASTIKGDKVEAELLGIRASSPIKLLSYRYDADKVKITTSISGKQHKIIIAPVGADAYSIEGKSKEDISDFSIDLSKSDADPNSHNSNFKFIFK